MNQTTSEAGPVPNDWLTLGFLSHGLRK